MSEQDGRQATAIQRPTTNDPGAWKAYWEAQGQEWRTEPEIDIERRKYLAERRNIAPDWKQGIFPFKDIKLSRADIEWLLATHENGRGPVDWNDESQRSREGLDVRGADLSKEDLSRLPLTAMQAGLTGSAWFYAGPEQAKWARAYMRDVTLIETHLEGAKLNYADLEGANLFRAYLEEAVFTLANMERAYLNEAYLEGAKLKGAHLEGVNFKMAHLEGKSTRPTDLRGAFFDSATLLEGAILGKAGHRFVKLADVSWGGVNLSVVKWSEVIMLGDEYEARQTTSEGKKKDRNVRLGEYEGAVRANRQLAIVLRNQGLNEEADHFTYRAQLLQRKVLWRQHEFGRWLFSLLLALLSGYGYRIWRILAAYLLMVTLFALAYFVLGMHYAPHLPLDQAFLESITAFHGRVFLEQFSSNTPQIWLTALEAIVGLIIEGVFIAMLIQRFFSK